MVSTGATFELLGRLLLQVIATLLPNCTQSFQETYCREPLGSQEAHRAMGLDVAISLVAGLAGLVLAGLPAAFLLVAGWHLWAWRSRVRRDRAEILNLRRSLPEAYGLLSIAAASGLNAYKTFEVVATSVNGPLGVVFDDVMAGMRSGLSVTDAVRRCGVADRLPEIASLARAVAAAERRGSRLGVVFSRLAADAAEKRRREAEAEARKAPVRILFPLVACVLPSFVLLTVLPVFADTFALVKT